MAANHSRKIFVNLPVRDLKRSVDLFTRLGFTFDPRFTDDKATCMIVGEEAYVMRGRATPGQPLLNRCPTTDQTAERLVPQRGSQR